MLRGTQRLVTALVLMLIAACGQTPNDQALADSDSDAPPISITQASARNVVEVTTSGMNFILPSEIPSGWTTFTYQNLSPWTHFMLIDRLPVYEGEQISFSQFKQEVPPHFVTALELIQQDKKNQAFEALGQLPPWFLDVEFKGGVGLVSPGQTGQSTVFLEPGEYVVECYVKTNGVFHPMQVPLSVSQTVTAHPPPAADVTVTLSSTNGLELSGTPGAGTQTFAVRFADQKAYEHFLGHDVHLMKVLSPDTLEKLAYWMDWSDKRGLETPAPGVFIGGMQDLAGGKTGYFTVDLQPGDYALVAEVPNPVASNLLKTFTVQAAD